MLKSELPRLSRNKATILGACGLLIFFNLFVAVRPPTASPPPLVHVPEDLFLHEGWGAATYIRQADYLTGLFRDIEILQVEDSISSSPDTFAGSPNITVQQISDFRMPSSLLQDLEENVDAIPLLASSSRARCDVPEDNRIFEPGSCRISILVSERNLESGSSLVLVQVWERDDHILLFDVDLTPNLSIPRSGPTEGVPNGLD